MTAGKDMSLHEDVEALLEEFQKSGLRELHFKSGDVELYFSTDPSSSGVARVELASSPPRAAPPPPPAPMAPVVAASSVAPPSREAWPADAITVRAPYLGTFYRSPKPGAPCYVEVGSSVDPETELCMVEVMKLFTSVRAGVRGQVHAVLAHDGQLVQAEQPLFVLLPAS